VAASRSPMPIVHLRDGSTPGSLSIP
jgi:hypothetical protein